MNSYLKKLIKSAYTKWLMMFVLVTIVFAVLDVLFGVVSNLRFLDIGFIAFIILWCANQDKIKKEGK